MSDELRLNLGAMHSVMQLRLYRHHAARRGGERYDAC